MKRQMDNILNETIGRKIVLFGAGHLAVDYIRKYGGLFKPALIIDNDVKKQGKSMWDIPIEGVCALGSLVDEEMTVIICSKAYAEIEDQLCGLNMIHCYRYNPNVDYIGVFQNSEAVERLPIYEIGYVPGVYDLYHVGHLNLLKKSKARCKHLIVGVLTDELAFYFKHKYPYIPFAERVEIIKSVRYVDQVIQVDDSNTVKMDAWRQLHFDCHFSGDDHLQDWDVPLKALRRKGSNMEFFSYTKTTSSTQIKEKMKE